MAVLWSALLFYLGAIFGSFLNVLVVRTIGGESWVTGRSHCDYCRRQLKWYENIPIFSFLWLKGRCHSCRKPIGATHWLLEVLTGVLFVWWWWGGFLFFKLTQHPLTILQPLFWLVVGMLLLTIFISDLKYLLILDSAVTGLFIVALLYRTYLFAAGIMQPNDWWQMWLISLAALTFFVLLNLLTKGKGLGMGDVKLIFPLGLLLGWPRLLVAIQVAFLVGALVGVAMIGLKVTKLKQPIAFGPFLILGTVAALLWGGPMWSWYLSWLGFV